MTGEKLQQAIQKMQQGHIDEALGMAEELVISAPASPDAHHILALCHKANGNFDKAEKAFKAALALQPENAQILTNYGNLQLQFSRPSEAVRAYVKATSLAPDFVAAWAGLSNGYVRLHDYVQAERAIRKAISLQPLRADLWQGLGVALRGGNRLSAAEEAFRKATEIDPQNGACWVNLAVVLRLLGQPAKALPCLYEAEKAGFSGPELMDARAGALLDLAETHESLKIYQTLTKTHPYYVPAHESLAKIGWEHAPETQPLEALKRTALTQTGNVPLHIALVQLLLDQKQWDDVLAHLPHFEALIPPAHAALIKARAYEGLGDSLKARPLFEQCVTDLPNESAVRVALARYHLHNNQADQAAPHLAHVISLNPDDQMAWAYMGTVWRLLDDSREEWLHGYERLITPLAVDVPDGFDSAESFAAAVERALLPLHVAKEAPIDQSLRKGTQTSGHLFGYAEGDVAKARDAISRSIQGFVAGLPDDDSHPFLRRKSELFHFVGSWSVRLRSAGHHVNHVHGKGWISSAFYVSVPPSVKQAVETQDGWIQFGQPPLDLGLDLEPRRFIKPRAGMLALFPSYTWHGTVPFQDEAHRMTMAFDVVPAR